MATQSDKPGQKPFITNGLSPDAVIKEYIEAPLAAARQPAITTGLDLLAFMSALPTAFVTSEQRELKRLSRSGDSKTDSRIERLKLSIERANELHSTAMQGKARIDRALVSLSEEGHVFHGFVSDGKLHPQKGLTVRMTIARDGGKGSNALSATTDADGYFRILLGRDADGGRKTKTPEGDVELSERVTEWLSRGNAKTDTHTTAAAAEATSDRSEVLARVEILDANNNAIHEDPVPLVVNAGTAYREYVIENKNSGHDRPGPAGNSATRFLGNSNSREVHDMQNIKKNCRIDQIAADYRVFFATEQEAVKARYDYCAYCFGKAKSKR
jgi:hypothetical protein